MHPSCNISLRCCTTILFLLITFFHSETDAASINDPVQVLVTDHQTEEPLAGAGVALYYQGERLDSARTDDRGLAALSPSATQAGESAGELPTTFEVSSNYPNPFTEETRLDLDVPEDQSITAEVYNIIGRRIMSRELSLTAGTYHMDLSLPQLSTGVYLVRLRGQEQKTISITKTGHRMTATGAGPATPSIRVSGGGSGRVPARPEEDSYAGSQDDLRSSKIPSPGENTASPGEANTEPGTEITDEHHYEIRVGKEGYVSWTGYHNRAEETPVEVALRREYQINIVTLNDQEEPVSATLELTGDDIHLTVETPAEIALPAGEYQAFGQSDDQYFEESFEVASDTEVLMQPAGSLNGIKLRGEEHLPVTEATYDLHFRIRHGEDEISEVTDDTGEWQVLRTEMEVTFDPETTVGEVNALLEKYEAGIVSMLEGLSVVVIRYPDPGDREQLTELVNAFESEESVHYALTSGITRPEPLRIEEEEEQRKIPPGLHNISRIDHHLAIRGHGAWNARRYLQDHGDHPWLVIADAFGDDAPEGGEYATDIVDSDDFGTNNSHNHGYHVIGIITGSFDQVPFATQSVDDVTGIFPDDLSIRAVDIQTTEADTWPRRMNLIISRINDILDKEPGARIIVNTSLNSRGAYSDQNNPAVSWIQRVRGGMPAILQPGAGLEHKFLHFTSAGNATTPSGTTLPVDQHWIARDNSMFAYATLGDPVMNTLSLSIDIPTLTNTYVVENRRNAPEDDTDDIRPLPGCANPGSVMEGNLSAIGTDVWSYTTTWPGSATGTSMATPQAAGTAAMAWSLDSDLSVLEIKDLIMQTTEERPINSMDNEDCNDIYPQPVVDAYAAVLRAGGSEVRKSILDVNEDGLFDESDIQKYLNAFESDGDELDYSRYDLNADGRTGGDGRDRFDLSMDGQYGLVQYEAQGYQMNLNETQLEDVDILCYYAYSELYDGDTQTRDELLEGPCGIEERRNSPVAINDFASTLFTGGVKIRVLANDYNPDPQESIKIHEITRQPAQGNLTVVDDSTAIRFDAGPGFTGVATFDYTAINESGFVSQPATVTVTIWEFLYPFRPQLDYSLFNRIEIMLQNDPRDIVLSGFTPDRMEKALFLDRHGIPHDPGSLGGGITRAEALNRHGVVVGASMNEDEMRLPYRWHRDEEMTPLPQPESDFIIDMSHDTWNTRANAESTTDAAESTTAAGESATDDGQSTTADGESRIAAGETTALSGSSSLTLRAEPVDRIRSFVTSAEALLPEEARGLLLTSDLKAMAEWSGGEVPREPVTAESSGGQVPREQASNDSSVDEISREPAADDSSGDEVQRELVMSGNAVDINDRGVITGYYGPHAMIWTDEGYLNLSDHLRRSGMATSVNSKDRVAGVFRDRETSGIYGFVWYDRDGTALRDGDPSAVENDRLIIIEAPEESMNMVTALGDAGHVVGSIAPEADGEEIVPIEPYLWTEERGMQLLGTLGGQSGMAMDVNTHGQIVGTAQLENGESAGFLWMEGDMIDINQLVPDETFRIMAVFDINDSGAMSVVGYTSEEEVEVRMLEPDLNSVR